jgi:hypothetical protein
VNDQPSQQEAEIFTEAAPPPPKKKHRGWPKGKKRSMRTAKASTPTPTASSSTTDKRVAALVKARAAAKANRIQRAVDLNPEPFPEADAPEPRPIGRPRNTRTFIYRPIEEGDRLEIEMAGIKFRANVPVEVSDGVTILQLLREERDTPDGIRTRAVERKVPLYQVVTGNPWFEVDGVRPQRSVPGTKVPDTADEYRGYAITWIFQSTSAAAMDLRWAGEEGLRQRCGVNVSDRNYLMPFFQARHKECSDLDAQRAA